MIHIQGPELFTGSGNAAAATGFLAFLAAFAMVAIVIFLAVYVYMAFAWMTIARKLGYDKPWIAWIPLVNFFLLPILAKKEWAWGFILLVPIVNIVFATIWTWNIYEQRKYPGWLSLVGLGGFIPFLQWLAGPAAMVIQGLVAWKDL